MGVRSDEERASEILAWLRSFAAFVDLMEEHVAARSELDKQVRESGSQPSEYLDEYRKLRDEYSSSYGPYRFVTAGYIPRFREVWAVNDQIRNYVERDLQSQDLYIQALLERENKLVAKELYVQWEYSRKEIKKEWDRIGVRFTISSTSID